MASLFLFVLCGICAAHGAFPSINASAFSHVVVSTGVLPIHSVPKSHFHSVVSTIPHPGSQSVLPFSSHAKSVNVTKSMTVTRSIRSASSHAKSISPSKTSVIPKPSHSPTMKPTTGPKPTTSPPSKPKDFNVKNKNNTVCIRMRAVIKMTVTYMKKNKKTDQKIIRIDEKTPNVSVTGNCTKDSREVIITEKDLKLHFRFQKSNGGNGIEKDQMEWKQTMLSVNVNTTSFVNSSGKPIDVKSNHSFFHSDLGTYYHCNSGIDVNVKNVTFDFSQFKIQPFAESLKVNSTDKGFGKSGVPCEGDVHPSPTPTTGPDNDIVPIAVGCALAGLVVIVLIAYIIGRRRTHRGYQQV